MNLEKLKSHYVEHLVLSPHSGVALFNVLHEAALVALTEHIPVKTSHNDREFVVTETCILAHLCGEFERIHSKPKP